MQETNRVITCANNILKFLAFFFFQGNSVKYMYASPHLTEKDILWFTPTVHFLHIKHIVQNYNPINMQLKFRKNITQLMGPWA